MMDTKLLYKVHKWLALFVAALTLIWFVSGAVLALPPNMRSLSPGVRTDMDVESRLPGAPEFSEASITPGAAIAAVQTHVGAPIRVTSVVLRRLPGRLAYDLQTEENGRHLVDAMSGTAFTIDEESARQILKRFLGPDVVLGDVAVQGRSFVIPIRDGKGTVAEVNAAGDTQLEDPLSRAAHLVSSFHEFGFLYSIIPPRVIDTVFLAMSIAGTIMTLAGVLILWSQFQRWRARRRMAPDQRDRSEREQEYQGGVPSRM